MKPNRLISSSSAVMALNFAIAVSAGLAMTPFAPSRAVAAECDSSPKAGIDWSGCRKRNHSRGERLERRQARGCGFHVNRLAQCQL
ncbi:MAG: hypothetical protein R3D29_04205 [Nitratireductor sp.]